ncbi:MAG: RNA 2',3'-cyclic phosphodiesterase [Chloroflexi bacterium]|nr:RNA 2',3'-cyclic phosphodiesterase [Chloroflexota bacterium]
MQSIRAFIAIEFGEAVRRRIAEVQERLRRAERLPVRWTRAEGTHVTLKFLGDVPSTAIPQVSEAVAQAAGAARPFRLEIEGVGGFPTMRRARVVWLGLAGEVSALEEMKQAVERTVAPLGFPTEGKPFHPHVTLGRLENGARPIDLERLLARVELPREPLAQGVAKLVLYRSELQAGGSVYTALSGHRLAG